MIILFGSFARDEYVEDVSRGYFSDLDVLVIVKSERLVNRHTLWSQIRRHARRVTGKSPLTLIVHTIDDVNQQLERGRYFFSDIKKEGILLHDSGRFVLAEEKESTPEERQAYARACFDGYFGRAQHFYEYVEFGMQKGWHNEAAFHLHQAAESCYKAVLLVFTAYLPKSHKLDELGKKCGDLHPAFRDIFPRITAEDRARFDLLEAAYVDARYSLTYSISRQDLDILAACVRELLSRTEQACRERIAAMTSA